MLFKKKKNYTRQGKILQAREIDHILFCMESATVLVTWRHALVKQVEISAKGSIVGAKSDPQTTSIRSLKLDSVTFLPGSLWSWNWICLLLISTSTTQESKHMHCRQIGVNWWTSPKPLNQLCEYCYVFAHICNWVTQVTLINPIHP